MDSVSPVLLSLSSILKEKSVSLALSELPSLKENAKSNFHQTQLLLNAQSEPNIIRRLSNVNAHNKLPMTMEPDASPANFLSIGTETQKRANPARMDLCTMLEAVSVKDAQLMLLLREMAPAYHALKTLTIAVFKMFAFTVLLELSLTRKLRNVRHLIEFHFVLLEATMIKTLLNATALLINLTPMECLALTVKLHSSGTSRHFCAKLAVMVLFTMNRPKDALNAHLKNP